MIPELLRKHTERAARESQATHAGESWNPMLSVVQKDGTYIGLGYGRLLWVNFNPDIGILVHFGTHTVRIKGRKLEPLYRQLMLLRTREIAAVDAWYDLGDGEDPVVTELDVIDNTKGDAVED